MAVGCVDVYHLPIPEEEIEAYVQQATTFGAVVKEHGALSYREFRADGEQIADMSQMRYGGFQTLVDP